MRLLVTSASALLAAAALALAAPMAADAATFTTVGNDISWPQCANDTQTQGPLPNPQTFAIVGVNDGLANTSNPCFGTELAWAQKLPGASGQPNAQLYVNTANPGKAASWWPRKNVSILGSAVGVPATYGTCTGKADAACAYVYGWSMAEEDAVTRVGAGAKSFVWWLDVETGNSWSKTVASNRADLEGMVSYLKGLSNDPANPVTVGVYSTSYQWGKIAGTVPSGSPLHGLPTWLAGATSQEGAKSKCGTASFTGGSNLLAQWLASGDQFDSDLSCVD